MKKFLPGALVGLFLLSSPLCATQFKFINGMDNETWEHGSHTYTNIHLVINYESNEEKGETVLNLPSRKTNVSTDIGKSPDTLLFWNLKLELFGTPENSSTPQSLWVSNESQGHLKGVMVGLSYNPFFQIRKGEEQYRQTCAIY